MAVHDKSVIEVNDAMDPNPLVLSSTTKLLKAQEQLVQTGRDSLVVVSGEPRIVRGALSLRDIVVAIQSKRRKINCLADLCAAEAFVLRPGTSLLGALAEMNLRQLAVVAVVERGQILGELKASSIGQKFAALLEKNDRAFRELKSEIERKDEYLGIVSHDIRAPLTVIQLSSDYLLSEQSIKTLTADQKSFIHRIRSNGEQAASMVNDILDVMRLHHGQKLDYQYVLFSKVLEQCLENIELIAKTRNISFEVNHNQDVYINLDRKRISQVIENLVINAIKYSPENGKVFLSSWLNQQNGGPYLAFQIRDQGQGIRKEDEARVFQAFVQTGTPHPRVPGVGLGLAIVKKFVEFHQGTIEIDGGWQKGVSITIQLPGASADAGQHLRAPVRGPTILLVEDDESIREFYKQAITAFSYNVIEAGDGSEGFALFQQNHVDLVLSDIRMPKMDGLELLSRIRLTGSATPVILCSGYYIGLENDLSSSAHKPNRIFDKPFKVKDMVDAIEEQLNRFRHAS